MIKPIDDTIDFLSSKVREYHSKHNGPSLGEDLIDDLDILDRVKSYSELNKCHNVWFGTISIHSYQTDYLVEAFVRYNIADLDDILLACNCMGKDRYDIRVHELLKGFDIINERRVRLGGDDELLNILDI
jgi:hypothetical protein